MKTEPYPEIKFKPLSYNDAKLINRIKQRVYLSSDEEIMSWIREHFQSMGQNKKL